MYQKPSIYVQDVNESVLGATASYYNATITAVTSTSFSTFTMNLPSTDKVAKYLTAGNYLTFLYRGKAWRFQIVTAVYADSGFFTVTANGLPLSLINDQLDAMVAPSELQDINYYLAETLQGTGWVVGKVAVSGTEKHKLSFDSSSVISRLFNIASAFYCELDFSLELSGLLVKAKKVNVVKQLGSERHDIQLGWGDNVTDISKTVDISSMVTALKLTGANGINLKNVDYVSDDKRFKSPLDDSVLYDTEANKKYNLGSNYLVGTYEDDTATDTAHLTTSGINQLKTLSQPTTTIETSLAYVPSSLELGDTISIISNDPNTAEYLKTRVVELDMCLDDPSKSTAKFGDYKSLTDDDLSALIQLKKQVANVTKIANTATEGIAEAKELANTANNTANTANETANTANSTAKQAETDAQTASATASSAMTAVTGVQADASTAKANAESAKQLAEDTAKLAQANESAISTTQDNLATAQADITKAKTDLATAQADITKAQADATDALTKVGTVSGSVTTLTTTVNNQAGTISTLAKQTDLDTLNKTVSTQGTSIDQNTKAIALKANQTDLDMVTGRLTTAETNIKATADGVSSTATAIVAEAITNMKIGENLLLNSATMQGDGWLDATQPAANMEENGDGTLSYVAAGKWKSTRYNFSDLIARNVVAIGDVLTYSEDVFIGDGFTQDGGLSAYGDYLGIIPGKTIVAAQSCVINVRDMKQGWQRISVAFTVTNPPSTSDDYRNALRFEFSHIADTGHFKFARPKLEKGAKATDWTPAPKDVNELKNIISTQGTVIDQNTKAIALKANQTDLDKATDRLTTAESNIKATADGVTTTATKIVSDKLASLTIGGRNLLLNSATMQGIGWLDATQDPSLMSDNGDSTLSYVATGNFKSTRYNFSDLIARNVVAIGDTVTYSEDVYVGSDLPDTAILYLFTAYLGNNSPWQAGTAKQLGVGWHRLSHTFTVTALSDTTTIDYAKAIRFEWGSTNGVGSYKFARPKLEKGSIASDWTPAPEDISTRLTTAEQELTSDAITATVMHSQSFADWQTSVDAKPDQADLDAVSGAVDALGNQVQTNVSEISTIKQTASGTKTTVDTLVTSVAGNTKVTQDIQNYMGFNSDGLTLGKSNSDMQVNITNDQLSFLSNGGTVAYINGQRLYITDAQVLNSIVVGHHKITKYSDDGETTVVTFAG